MSDAYFSAEEFAGATGGVWQSNTGNLPGRMGISTDTRIDGKDKVFFALSGENFDAHNFLEQAAASGCCALCIRKNFSGKRPPLPCLEVDDVLRAYQQMAKFHRDRFPALKVAAITGSVGKTSTKEMLRAIFTEFTRSSDAVLYTIGNTNNHIGVPQNLLRLNENHRFAVIEMGTSSPGEIAPLSRMASPHAAGVNTVAACHLEKLIDLDGVAAEKGTVYSGMDRANGIAIMGDECHGLPILQSAAQGRKTLLFGSDQSRCDVAVRHLSGNLDGASFELIFPGSGKRFTVEWRLSGEHQTRNAACAAALSLALDIPEETIAAGLSNTTLPGMRMKQTVIDGVTYINDAYNANPASMRALLELLQKSAVADKLILCLGSMRELGSESRAEHEKLLSLIAEKFPGIRLITIGREFENIPGNGNYFQQSAQAKDFLASIVTPGDIVAAKGSNSNHVELALPEAAR